MPYEHRGDTWASGGPGALSLLPEDDRALSHRDRGRLRRDVCGHTGGVGGGRKQVVQPGVMLPQGIASGGLSRSAGVRSWRAGGARWSLACHPEDGGEALWSSEQKGLAGIRVTKLYLRKQKRMTRRGLGRSEKRS